ncbi:splicing regulatory glutamine/lysine-rich protein 1-like isoform X1 [Polyodon spathula]|uniref:splicing regulatory glutamine/lysine-rich protein 1-like isoform X1 n=1 Tax=Polyodon spathula TaxID=7913 RepID=UPI001B7E77EA|nr:splicing regulatory glutamine/lysine-rich protein 1-like isoform X1 [Polyodon spathula]
MSGVPGTCVIQVTNLSPAVTSEQMRTLFSFLGDVEELRLYPPDNAPLPFSSKVCYIKFREPPSVGVAQHLTNTVFIDRALIVVPCAEGKIPEEAKALSLLAPATTVATLMPGAGLLPIPTPPPLPSLGIPIGNLGTLQAGLDPSLAALGGISSQPPLMGNVDPSKIDEIRRTVYVGNLNSQTTTAEQLLEYFKQVGDVKFVRMAGDETQPTRFAFVEFADQESVPRALTYNGVVFGDRPLKINHSNNAIVKPPEMTAQAAAKELEDVMKRVREAQSCISAAIEPVESGKSSTTSSKKAGRSRSRSQSKRKRSRSRHRSRSRKRSRSKPREARNTQSSQKKRSRSKDRKRSRSRSRSSRDKRKEKDNKSRSKEESSREKDERKRKEKRGKSPPKSSGSSRRSRSTSRNRRKRSRSRSKSPRPRTPKRKFKSPSPRRIKKEKRKDKVRERSRERNERERSPSRKKSSKDKEKLEKHTPVKVERDSGKEEKEYESDKDSIHTNRLDHIKGQQNGSYNNHEEDLSVQTEVSE